MKVAILQQVYKSAKYVPRVYEAILSQDYPNINVYAQVCVDDGAVEIIKNKFPQVKIIDPKYNIGFCKGHNELFDATDADIFVLVNPDCVLERDYVSRCVKVLYEDTSLAAVTGKVFKYDFDNDKKLDILDTTGISVYKSGRVRDRGQGEIDEGQYDGEKYIAAISGCCPVYRKSALEDIRFENQFFDEDFFAYYDDTDLSLRFLWRGWKIGFVPEALAYHSRQAAGTKKGMRDPVGFIKKHRALNEFIKAYSYKNRILNEIKNYPKLYPKLLIREVVLLCYIAILETSVLKVLPKLFAQSKRAWRFRNHIQATKKITIQEFEKWLS